MAATTLHASSPSAAFLENLRSAETVRKKIVLNYSVIGTVLFIGLIIEAVTWMSIAVAVIALFVLVYINWYGIPVSTFENLYIRAVTGHSIEGYPWLSIDYQSHMKSSELQSAGWIRDTPDYFSGKNLIHGSRDGVSIRLSEIYLKMPFAQGLCASNGTCNTLMLRAEIPHMDMPPVHLVTSPHLLQHPLSEDPVERVVLHREGTAGMQGFPAALADLAAGIMDFHRKYGSDIVASVRGHQLSCAILLPEQFHYFKPRLTKTVFSMEPVVRFDRDLQFLVETALSLSEHSKRG